MTTQSKAMIERKKVIIDFLKDPDKKATVKELMAINNYTRYEIQNTLQSLRNNIVKHKLHGNRKAYSITSEKTVNGIININVLKIFYANTVVRGVVW